MQSSLPQLLALAAASLLLTSCGSIPTKTFRVDAIDSGEEPVPCVVVIDQDWTGARERKQFVNVNSEAYDIALQFQRAEVEVTVAQVVVDPDTGKVTWCPTRATDSDPAATNKSSSRRVRMTDPAMQLFILGR